MNKKGLTARDLITLGVFNAIAIVCYIVIVAVCCSTVVGMFFCTAAAFFALGTLYMLIVAKVGKRGTYLICGIIMSMVGIIGGRISTTIGCLAGGILAELLVGNYKNFKRIVLGYCAYAAGFACGIYFPGMIFGAQYIASRGRDKGVSEALVNQYANMFSPKFILLIVLFNMLMAMLGAFLGRSLLKKHFVKAGLIKEAQHEVFSYERAKRAGRLYGIRKLFQNPEVIIQDYVKEGMKAADIGCGLGYFTIPLLKKVGKGGQVVAVDLQEKMLLETKEYAKREGAAEALTLNRCDAESLCIEYYQDTFDFILLFAVAHEVDSCSRLFCELYESLKEDGKILFAEPAKHVSKELFDREIESALQNGFLVEKTVQIPMSQAVLLSKSH